MKRAVLFDLDGVLVDSRAAQLATLAGFATSALDRRVTIDDLPPGAETIPREQVLAHLGLDRSIDENGWDAASATATLVAKVFPFVVATLTELRAADVATGVVTLRSRRCLHWLLPPDVIDLLDTIVCYEDATPKPAPDGLLLALDRLGATPSSAVFVGDTDADMRAARAAGVTAVGAGWGFAGPDVLTRTGADLVLSEPTDLTAVLLRLVGVPQLTGFPSDLDF